MDPFGSIPCVAGNRNDRNFLMDIADALFKSPEKDESTKKQDSSKKQASKDNKKAKKSTGKK